MFEIGMNVMSEAKAGTVTCRLCGATFNTVEERERHNAHEHPKEMARMLQELSEMIDEKGAISKADWEKKFKEIIAH
jgi:uncharacterized Zn finger protein (UPF0148 family)